MAAQSRVKSHEFVIKNSWRSKKKTRLQYCTDGRHMNRIGFSHGKFDILFISGLKTAYWSRVFFFERQLFLMTNSKFQTPLTLTSHNSGSKHRSIENHHIFRFVRTSAFTWCSPCRVYEIRMSRKCGKHKKYHFSCFWASQRWKKVGGRRSDNFDATAPAHGSFWPILPTFLMGINRNDDTLKFWGPRPPQSWKNQICVPKKTWFGAYFLDKIIDLTHFEHIYPPPWYTSLESYGSQARFCSELSRF